MSSNILRLSVSKTKTYLDCAKKFHFAYILKLPRKEYDFHTFGKFMHQILEDFHQAYIDKSTDPYNKVMGLCYKNALAEYKDKLTEDIKKEAYSLIDQYLKIIYNDDKLLKRVSSVEKEFKINVNDNLMLTGMIDRIETEPDGIIHICDYKTTKNKKYIKNDFFQLLVYAYVIYLENPLLAQKVRCSYIMLRHGFEYITREFSQDEILSVKDKLEDYAKMINEEELYRAKPTPLCSYCDWNEKCSEGLRFINKRKTNGKITWD